jgi:hypothetical protein
VSHSAEARQPDKSARRLAIRDRWRRVELQGRRQTTRVLKLAGSRPTGERPDYAEFYPPVRNARDLSDLSARVNCYLAGIEMPLYLPGPRFDLDANLVPHFDPALVADCGWTADRPQGRAYLIIHRLTPGGLGRLVTHHGAGAAVVDKDLYKMAEMSYWRVRDRLMWPNYPSADRSLQRLRERVPSAEGAFVLATGPSALEVDLDGIDDEVRITCNSAIRDRHRMSAFRPTIVAFTDPVFHFGPSRYAAQFRRDLLTMLEYCDPLLLCGAEWVGPLLNMLPQLSDRLVAIPRQAGGPWRWPTDRDPTTRPTESVLTNLLLPIAFTLADNVRVAGVDGRQPSESYFWKHGLQYSDDLMQSAFDAHPAFFRDRDFADHYVQYCEEIELMIRAGEAAGKTVQAAAPSWIPAFRKRGAAVPQSA